MEPVDQIDELDSLVEGEGGQTQVSEVIELLGAPRVKRRRDGSQKTGRAEAAEGSVDAGSAPQPDELLDDIFVDQGQPGHVDHGAPVTGPVTQPLSGPLGVLPRQSVGHDHSSAKSRRVYQESVKHASLFNHVDVTLLAPAVHVGKWAIGCGERERRHTKRREAE